MRDNKRIVAPSEERAGLAQPLSQPGNRVRARIARRGHYRAGTTHSHGNGQPSVIVKVGRGRCLALIIEHRIAEALPALRSVVARYNNASHANEISDRTWERASRRENIDSRRRIDTVGSSSFHGSECHPCRRDFTGVAGVAGVDGDHIACRPRTGYGTEPPKPAFRRVPAAMVVVRTFFDSTDGG